MIKKLEDNDVFEAMMLMNKTITEKKHDAYKKNEYIWIQSFMSLIEEQRKENPCVLVIGDYDSNNKLRGFLSASAFVNSYDGKYVMDVRDCIVNHDYKNNAFVIYRLFDAMINHVKEKGGKYWRADSIRSEQEAFDYGRFLQHRYNAKLHVSVRGEV
jgi:hypothetical protein